MMKVGVAVPKRVRGLLLVLVVLLVAAAYDSTAALKKYVTTTGRTMQTFIPDFISKQSQANNNITFANILVNNSSDEGRQPPGMANDEQVVLSVSRAESTQEDETQEQHDEAAVLLGNQLATQPITDKEEASEVTMIHQASLQYAKHLQANMDNVEFNANFTLTSTGEACFTFVVDKTYDQCSFPYIRVRLSGSALVHVPLQRRRTDGSRFDGCTLLPVPGTYYIDANLIHCRMNTNWKRVTRIRKFIEASGQPVKPDLSVMFTPYEVVMPPFIRNASFLRQPSKSAYPYHAWVFAPLCPDSDYRVAESCAKTKTPQFLPTKFQLEEWLQIHNYSSFFSPELRQRFDNYMWLPVNPTNGSIDFDAEHFGHNYTPMPSFLQQSKSGRHNQTILFVGASHVRYLANQLSQIYYNLTYGHDGCVEEHVQPPDLGNNYSRFHHNYLSFGRKWIQQPIETIIGNSDGTHHDKIIISYGQWVASAMKGTPSLPGGFVQVLLSIIAIMDKISKPEAEIFVLTVNHNSMGRKALQGIEWRIPPLIDAYNDQIWNQVTVDYPITGTRSFRFKNFNRTYLLDNSDIMDPIWDSAEDFNHPCRYGTRIMALRVLDLLKE